MNPSCRSAQQLWREVYSQPFRIPEAALRAGRGAAAQTAAGSGSGLQSGLQSRDADGFFSPATVRLSHRALEELLEEMLQAARCACACGDAAVSAHQIFAQPRFAQHKGRHTRAAVTLG